MVYSAVGTHRGRSGPGRRGESLRLSGGEDGVGDIAGESRGKYKSETVARWCREVRAAVAVGVTPTETMFEIRRINEDFKGEKC